MKSINGERTLLAIKSLSHKCTAGTNMVLSFLVKECAYIFAELFIPYIILYCPLSLPYMWKTSRICPVFKTGSNCELSSYLDYLQFFRYFRNHSLTISYSVTTNLSPRHGFITGRSTTINFTCFTEFKAEMLDSRGQFHVIYTHFSKAFDCIPL